VDYIPDPETTWEMARSTYKIRNNLLVQFTDDTLDDSAGLAGCLSTRFPGKVLRGLAPIGRLRWI